MRRFGPTDPFFDVEEITLNQVKSAIKIKNEYAESYTLDDYTYDVDVDFTKFSCCLNNEITRTGDYTLKLSTHAQVAQMLVNYLKNTVK